MHNIYELYEDFEIDSESEKVETFKTLEIKDNTIFLELKKDKNIKTSNNKNSSSDNVDDIGCKIEGDSKKKSIQKISKIVLIIYSIKIENLY